MRIPESGLRIMSLIAVGLGLSVGMVTKAQDTRIQGFANVDLNVEDEKLNFGFGEWDLFVTSDLNDKFSFLGETVFKYSPHDESHFGVGVERLIVNYNYKKNHSVLFGKHHTPISYWNDAYHHGRVFFPTIERPLLFAAGIIPIHTTGVALQGLNLGKLRWGYNLMVGNGIGSEDIADNDEGKSVTLALSMQPIDDFKVAASFYSDEISKGADLHGSEAVEGIQQRMATGSISYFGRKFEVLTEGTFINNTGDSTGVADSYAAYFYTGVRIKNKWVPYARLDYLTYQKDESYFYNENTLSFVGGLRYEVSYVVVIKLEYQQEDRDLSGYMNKVSAQIAIGF